MHSLYRVLRNLTALGASLVLERAVSFVLFLFIARQMGAESLGEYGVAFSFLAIFETISIMGQNLLLVREVARQRDKAAVYLVNSSALVGIAALFCAVAMALTVRWLGYPASTVALVSIMALVLIPDTLSVVPESIIQGWERMEIVTVSRFATNLVGTSASMVVLLMGYGLEAVLVVLLFQRAALVLLYGVFVWYHQPPTQWRPDATFIRLLTRVSLVFLGMGVFAALFKNADMLILRRMTDASEAGLYVAAGRPIQLLSLLAPLLMLSLFPSLAEAWQLSHERFERLIHATFRALAIAVPITSALIFVAAPQLVPIVYGQEYGQATVLSLQILAWSLVPTFMAALLFRAIIASNNERVSLRVSGVNAVVNITLNLLLVPRYGAVGASISALATGVVGLAQNYWFVHRNLIPVRLFATVRKPLLCAASALLAYLAAPALGFYGQGIVAVLVYAAALVATGVVSRRELEALRWLYRRVTDRSAVAPKA